MLRLARTPLSEESGVRLEAVVVWPEHAVHFPAFTASRFR